MRTRGKKRDLICWFVNVDNNRPDDIVAAELKAIRAMGADVIGLCETTSNRLPHLRMATIGDRRGGAANRPRRNIFGYVDRGLPLGRTRWHDLRWTWPRTKGPGEHEPRSFPTTRIGKIRFGIGHAPPGVRGADNARGEFVRAVTKWARRRPWLPVLFLLDANGLDDEIAGAANLDVSGKGGVDKALTRRIEVVSAERVDTLGVQPKTVTFAGDHGHVLRVVIRVPARWLRPLIWRRS